MKTEEKVEQLHACPLAAYKDSVSPSRSDHRYGSYSRQLCPGGGGGGGTQAFFDRDARPRTNFNYPKK